MCIWRLSWLSPHCPSYLPWPYSTFIIGDKLTRPRRAASYNCAHTYLVDWSACPRSVPPSLTSPVLGFSGLGEMSVVPIIVYFKSYSLVLAWIGCFHILWRIYNFAVQKFCNLWWIKILSRKSGNTSSNFVTVFQTQCESGTIVGSCWKSIKFSKVSL